MIRRPTTSTLLPYTTLFRSRAAGEQLAEHAVVRVGLRQDQRRQFARGPEPVFGERFLQAGDHRAAHPHMGVAPGRQRWFDPQVLVADVMPANKTHQAVDHYHFAMVAEIHLEAVQPATAGGERTDMHTAFTQGLDV